MNVSVSKLISINIISVFLLFGISNTDNTDWQLITEDNSTKVYTRKSDQSSIKEIRMTALFHSDLKTFKEVLGDVSGYPDWVFKCMGSERLYTESSNNYHYYLMTNMPYPVSNRDLVVHTKNWNFNNTYYSQSFSKPDYISQKDGMVRVPKFTSYWKVTPLDNQMLQIEYESSTDPGGYIPAWVINLGITKGPINTMKSLKKVVEQKYESK